MSYAQGSNEDFQPRRQKRSRDEDDEEGERQEDFSHKPRRLLEEDSSPVYSEDNLAKIEDDRPLIKHSGLKTHNLFLMSESDRKSFLASHPNPYNYPKLYKSIYDRERRLRKPVGYQNCQNITDRKLFQPNGQLSKNLIISNKTNTNCIMTKDIKGLEHSFLSYSYETILNPDPDPIRYLKSFINANCGILSIKTEEEIDNESSYWISKDDEFYFCEFDAFFVSEEAHRKYVLKTIEEIKANINKFGKTPKFTNFSSRAIADILIEINKEVVDQDLSAFIENTIVLINQTIEVKKSTALSHIESYLDDFYKSGVINFCEPLEFFIMNIYEFFGPYVNNIVIAGGAALSYYILKNYGYATYFSDIDVFIHGMEGREQEIIDYIYSKNHPRNLFYSDGAFAFITNKMGSCKTVRNRYDDFTVPVNKPYDLCQCKHVKFIYQIILRSYCSPSEVIHGFDVDSSCVLVNKDLEIYGTERFMYAVSKGYNTINFDRMSPSYPYRIFKFYQRGFAIWIPEIEYVKNNTIFNVRFLDKRNLGLLWRKIMGSFDSSCFDRKEISDYTNVKFKMNRYRKGVILNFITIDPGQQISSTNNKEVLEDPIVWYPKFDLKGNHLVAYSGDFDKTDPTMVEIVDPINSENRFNVCENVVVKSVRYKEDPLIKQSSDRILRELNVRSGSRLIVGDIVSRSISGNNYNPKLRTHTFLKPDSLSLFKEFNPNEIDNLHQSVRDLAIAYLYQARTKHLLESILYNMKFVHSNDEMSMELFNLIINNQIDVSELLQYHCAIVMVVKKYNPYDPTTMGVWNDIIYGEEEIINHVSEMILQKYESSLKEAQYVKNENVLDRIGTKNITFNFNMDITCLTKYNFCLDRSYKGICLNAVNPFVQRLIFENQRCINDSSPGFVGENNLFGLRKFVLNLASKNINSIRLIDESKANFSDQSFDDFVNYSGNLSLEDLFYKPGEMVTIFNNISVSLFFDDYMGRNLYRTDFTRNDYWKVHFIEPVDDLKSLTESIIDDDLDTQVMRNYQYYYVNGHYFTSRARMLADSFMAQDINSVDFLPYPAWQKFIRSEDTPVYTVKYHT